MKPRRFPCAYFLGSGLFFLLFLIAPLAYSQQICDPANPNNGACQQNGFPACYECALVGQVPQCVTDASFCDDNNACTEDICTPGATPVIPPDFPNGCINLPLALTGDPDLPIECYVCEPTENGVDVDNGICERAVPEDCSDSPEDCLVPGSTCVYPNNPTPVPVCDQLGPTNPGPIIYGGCEDGDRCTQNLCNFDTAVTPNGFFCTNPELGCNPNADGCCPDGCVGPGVGGVCPPSTTVTPCDPDCCPNQDCGDGMVEPAETCDDAADAGFSGVAPDGSSVTDAECRDSGAANECTYCGDGILDSPSEECDGALLGQCQTCTANCTCGLIVTPALCIFGSSPIKGEGGPAPACDCSLNPNAEPPSAYGWLWLAMLAAVSGVGLILKRRVR